MFSCASSALHYIMTVAIIAMTRNLLVLLAAAWQAQCWPGSPGAGPALCSARHQHPRSTRRTDDRPTGSCKPLGRGRGEERRLPGPKRAKGAETTRQCYRKNFSHLPPGRFQDRTLPKAQKYAFPIAFGHPYSSISSHSAAVGLVTVRRRAVP
ncbi:hypothetical protein CONLIGDRAFT_517352 [Coniochaeta ligniaria NRRL 30616]|uniref:Uncharacterized protein n=1 Tax=Coniochaeta ligniaria NRRL 30616 TaxID=1408157 RepID=A0A1J7JEQ6_9PEZI|nr:hypothetical protein CONLIGDRAFT_517352 [Coniochaeta ligniaria NRRL 30616]